MENESEVGVTTGMAWTQVGGDTLFIETALVPGTGKIELTGQLGDVMQESARTAITYIRSIASEYDIEEDFYKNMTFTSMCLRELYLKTDRLPESQCLLL